MFRVIAAAMILGLSAAKAEEAPNCPAPKPLSDEISAGPANTRLQKVTVPQFDMLASARVISAGDREHVLDRFPLPEDDGLGARNLCFPIGLHQVIGAEIAPGWQTDPGVVIGIAGVALRRSDYAKSHPALSKELRDRGQLIALPERTYFAYLRPTNTAPLDHRREEMNDILAHALSAGAGLCDAWLINTGQLVLVPICPEP
ncbi:MAG: hypothetical protein AAGC81_04880 [Pseudomonadota bacterium]